MLADPVTLAIVLGTLVIFLQTKFHFRVTRKGGRVDFELDVSRAAASQETITEVVKAVSGVAVK